MSKSNQTKTDAVSYATTQALSAYPMEQYNSFLYQYTTVIATPAAKTFEPGVAEVSTIVCTADAGVKEVQTMTFPTKADAVQGDYIIFYDTLGRKYAVSIDKNGTGVEPTGALWAGIASTRKKVCYIGAQTTAAQVAAKVLLSINQIADLNTSIMTWVDSGSGVLTGTQALMGPVTNPVPKLEDDSTAGGLLGAQTTAGVASSLQNTYFDLYAGGTNAKHTFWFNVNGEGVAPTIADTTMHAVALTAGSADTATATALNTVIDAMDEFASSRSTATLTVTCATKGNTTIVTDTGLTGFTVSTATPGIDDAFANGFVTNQIVIASHGFTTGLKAALTTSAADAPAGTSATNYWINKVDANTIRLYDSAANAYAGGATGLIDITDAGTGIHTLTPAAISGGVLKLQDSLDGTNWTDITSMTVNLTASATGVLTGTSKGSMIRPYLTMTTGQLTLAQDMLTKEY